MKKYCFLPTGNNVWIDVAIELYNNQIAKPVFWLGDDKHLIKAKSFFKKGIYSMDSFVHYQSKIKSNNYNSEYIDFFEAENYLRAKDRCLKMMDRLDNYGLFNRLDREVVFNKLCIWLLKEFHDTKPEFLIMSEFAHSHAQYLVYEICRYLGLKISKFNDWGNITPLLFLQNVITGERYKIQFNYPDNIKTKIYNDINNHVDSLSNRREEDNYLPSYINSQWKTNFFRNNYNNFLKVFIREFKVYMFTLRRTFDKRFYKINPNRVNVLTLANIYKNRKNNLIRHCEINSIKVDLKSEFVYFALHFEPERTTNPDGGFFHDQFLALTYLRKMLPDNVKIYVKEHPSQFKLIKRGIKGRSPLFYELIKRINKVYLLDINTSTYSLTKSSLFVATITGTAAREAAIMGKKALVFGDAWFNKCPNVFSWNEKLTFDKIMNQKIASKNAIFNFLKNEINQYAVPGCQNPSSQEIFHKYINSEFSNSEFDGIYELIKIFLQSN